MIIRAIQAHSRQQVNLTRLYNGMTTESHSDLTWAVVSDMEGITAQLYALFYQRRTASRKSQDRH
jgi:hypothetical protein